MDQAEGEWATTIFDQLKRQVRRYRTGVLGLFGALFGNSPSKPGDEAQAQTQPSSPGPEPASHPRLVAADQRSLNGVYVRLIRLTEQTLKDPRWSQLRDQLVNQRVATESAKANYQNAKLTREIAEIAITEYTDGIFLEDLATVEGKIRLARSDLQRSRDMLEYVKIQAR